MKKVQELLKKEFISMNKKELISTIILIKIEAFLRSSIKTISYYSYSKLNNFDKTELIDIIKLNLQMII